LHDSIEDIIEKCIAWLICKYSNSSKCISSLETTILF